MIAPLVGAWAGSAGDHGESNSTTAKTAQRNRFEGERWEFMEVRREGRWERPVQDRRVAGLG
jgi:hypothetical protein